MLFRALDSLFDHFQMVELALYPYGELSNTFAFEIDRDINISCFYERKMLFRALESLFDHFQMVEFGPSTHW